MTTAEKLISQGKIEAILEIKSGDRGLNCMKQIEPLDDLKKLQTIVTLAKKAPIIPGIENIGMILRMSCTIMAGIVLRTPRKNVIMMRCMGSLSFLSI